MSQQSFSLAPTANANVIALPACSVVIVNYQTPELVASCVESIRKHSIVPDSAVVVVDNGSADGSATRIANECPGIRLLREKDNLGFGHGVNVGVAATDDDIILVLNPDTRFVDRSVEKAAALMRADPTIGIVGLDLRNPDQTRQFSARRFYSLLDVVLRRTPLKQFRPFERRNARHLMMDSWNGEAFETDWVMGTGFLIRRAAFDAVNGMDTTFFLYMEDVDLCLRVRKAGWRVVAVVDGVLVHDHQRASASGILSPTGRAHLKSLAYFIRRHGMRPF